MYDVITVTSLTANRPGCRMEAVETFEKYQQPLKNTVFPLSLKRGIKIYYLRAREYPLRLGHAYTRVYTCIHAYTRVYTRIHVYTRVYTCIHAYTRRLLISDHCGYTPLVGTQTVVN